MWWRAAADADWWFRQLFGLTFLARFLSQLCASALVPNRFGVSYQVFVVAVILHLKPIEVLLFGEILQAMAMDCGSPSVALFFFLSRRTSFPLSFFVRHPQKPQTFPAVPDLSFFSLPLSLHLGRRPHFSVSIFSLPNPLFFSFSSFFPARIPPLFFLVFLFFFAAFPFSLRQILLRS